MRSCDLQTGASRLTRAAKDLREQWNATCEHWRDQNREDFDTTFIQPLTPQVSLLLAAISSLQEVLARAERDLADEEQTA